MIKRFLLFLAVVPVVMIFSGSSEYANKYLSPEQICYSAENQEIYVGYATSPELAILKPGKNKVEGLIALPSPVNGICTEGNYLYASLKDNESRIAVCDLKKRKVRKTVRVGYGPCDIEASGDKLLFVANRFSNDVSVVDRRKLKEIDRIRVLREPSAVRVSPDGQVLAVANALAPGSAMDNYISACVTMIDVDQRKVIKHIELPNGSFSLNDLVFSKDGKYIYVTHQVGRYNVLTSQIERGWINTNAVSVIDANTMEWYNTVLLDDLYRGAANPGGLEISGDGKRLYVAIAGTHELFVIDRKGMHKRLEMSREESQISQASTIVKESDGSIKVPVYKNVTALEPMPVLFEDIQNELGFLLPVRKRLKLQGNGTRNLAVVPSENGEKVYIPGYYSEGIDVLEFNEGEITMEYLNLGSSDPMNDPVRYGDMLFHDANNCFQEWQSCASCHPGEGRVDGLNWDLMNDGIGNPKNTKSLLYSHQTPPAMITGIRPDAETAVRAGFKYIQFHSVSEEQASAVDSYLRSLQPVPSPYLEKGKLSDKAVSGKAVFEKANCGQCHTGPFYTDLKIYKMGAQGKYDKQNSWDTPTLIELWRTGPYMHNGEFANIEDVFKVGMHGLNQPLSEKDVSDLSAYLLSL